MTKTKRNGNILLYRSESNTLDIKLKNDASGMIFKPTDKMDYWNDQ